MAAIETRWVVDCKGGIDAGPSGWAYDVAGEAFPTEAEAHAWARDWLPLHDHHVRAVDVMVI